MAVDIRLSVDFWDHPKTIKLQRHLGIEGIRSLQILWLWCRKNRPAGILTGMDAEDIEIAAKWEGESGSFVNESLSVRWLDVNDGIYELHDWQDHNPWSCDSEQRSDKARFSKLAFLHPEVYEKMKKNGICSISKSEFCSITKKSNGSLSKGKRTVNDSVTPSPSPSPSPSLIEKDSLSDDCIRLAEILSGIVRTKKNINIQPAKIKTWAKSISQMGKIDGVHFDRIFSALEWYAKNIGGEYIPVIESGASLREKFTKLEAAISRSGNGKDRRLSSDWEA